MGTLMQRLTKGGCRSSGGYDDDGGVMSWKAEDRKRALYQKAKMGGRMDGGRTQEEEDDGVLGTPSDGGAKGKACCNKKRSDYRLIDYNGRQYKEPAQ